MRIGTFDAAVKQAKANAKPSYIPWVVFSWNFQWHCESMATNRGNHTVVMPDGEILSHNEFMEQHSIKAWYAQMRATTGF